MKTKVRHTLWKSLGPGFCQLRTADHCVFVCVCVCVGLPYSCQLTEQHLISVLDVFMRTSACNKREGTEDRKWHSEHIETCLKEFKKVKKIMDDGCEDTCKVLIAETPECFICRDVQLVDGEPLKRFCDCKNLMAHHSCLLTWVRMGLKLEDQLKCRVCNATHQVASTTLHNGLQTLPPDQGNATQYPLNGSHFQLLLPRRAFGAAERGRPGTLSVQNNFEQSEQHSSLHLTHE
ncbi:uncharacterized protein LOC113642838 isoform X6 [Tachysurus fulvidraco]|uniref:uncharacterized protein LOC113642838 isoform X6 n=1 Tax=Tachysurus fulvidraco TaxID=1234273 RepID=UPI001FED529A|nr:uncharacterized protein LOC113642838 isoform X6 [Tachysurus fulvidraco]